jgi:hypothetical protein
VQHRCWSFGDGRARAKVVTKDEKDTHKVKKKKLIFLSLKKVKPTIATIFVTTPKLETIGWGHRRGKRALPFTNNGARHHCESFVEAKQLWPSRASTIFLGNNQQVKKSSPRSFTR